MAKRDVMLASQDDSALLSACCIQDVADSHSVEAAISTSVQENVNDNSRKCKKSTFFCILTKTPFKMYEVSETTLSIRCE